MGSKRPPWDANWCQTLVGFPELVRCNLKREAYMIMGTCQLDKYSNEYTYVRITLGQLFVIVVGCCL